MLSIKKVEVQPLDINYGKIIDSFSTTDDKTKNAPSINAVEEYAVSNTTIQKVSTSITTTTETQSLIGLNAIPYPTGFNKSNTFILSARIGYGGYYYTKNVTACGTNNYTDTVCPLNGDNGISFLGRLPSLEIGTTVTIELVLMKID